MRQKKRKRLRRAKEFASYNSPIPNTPDHSIFYSTKDKQFKMHAYEAENDDYDIFGRPSSLPSTPSSISFDESESATSCQQNTALQEEGENLVLRQVQMLKEKCKL